MKAVISEVKLQSNHVYLQENVDSSPLINLILSQRKKVNYKRSIFFFVTNKQVNLCKGTKASA